KQGSEFGSKLSVLKKSVSNNVDSVLNNFGSIIKDDKGNFALNAEKEKTRPEKRKPPVRVTGFVICSGIYKDFYDSLRLKTEVLDKMRVDEVSKTVIGDILICSYGESQLNRHKRVQLATMVSNKLRELDRLVLVLKEMTGLQRFLDVLKPEFFDNLVTATKVISGYDNSNKSFKAPSLARHMRTSLIQICDIATKMIIKKNRFFGILALKDLNEKQWEKPKMFPLTSELMQFQKYVLYEADNACENIKSGKKQLNVHFRKLSECVMALTLLLNRKRIGEIQFLKLNTYKIDRVSNQQKRFFGFFNGKRENFNPKFQKSFDRLPQDVFQTAKVSKILIAINNGKGAQYKGKSHDEIEFSDNVDSDDSDFEDSKQNTSACLTSKIPINNSSKDISDSASNDIPGPSKPYNKPILGQSVTETQIAYANEFDLNSSCSSKDGDTQRIKTTTIRKVWTKKQTDVIRQFFAKHIKEKIAPKKGRS
ncbi:hypothetical protein NQ314_009215, partial [Rhamnusium bicolor]